MSFMHKSGRQFNQPVLVRKSKEIRAGGLAQSVRCLLPKQNDEYNSLGGGEGD